VFHTITPEIEHTPLSEASYSGSSNVEKSFLGSTIGELHCSIKTSIIDT